MKYIRYIGFLFLFIIVNAQESEPEEVLFVGNSFTFYFNLPLVVESMAKEKGIPLNITQSTAGGASLKDHWSGKRKLSTRSLIQRKSFSKVVLQDYSTNPVIEIRRVIDLF